MLPALQPTISVVHASQSMCCEVLGGEAADTLHLHWHLQSSVTHLASGNVTFRRPE